MDEIVSYDLEMESFASSTKKYVVEVLEEYFHGTLDDKKIDKTGKFSATKLMWKMIGKSMKFSKAWKPDPSLMSWPLRTMIFKAKVYG